MNVLNKQCFILFPPPTTHTHIVEVPGENKIHLSKKVQISGMFLFYYFKSTFSDLHPQFPTLSKAAHGFAKASACISKHVEIAHWESYMAITAIEYSSKPST